MMLMLSLPLTAKQKAKVSLFIWMKDLNSFILYRLIGKFMWMKQLVRVLFVTVQVVVDISAGKDHVQVCLNAKVIGSVECNYEFLSLSLLISSIC